MNPLSSIYGLGVSSKNTLFDHGIRRPKHLGGPVVSIGNLSVGGSGKTPFVLLLGKLLQDRGIKFDVLSRGYGRSTRGVALVDPFGQSREFGDEPLLIARELGIPVIVGESRYEAGLLAEKEFGVQLHLLDDGFQHRALARDFDIVLVTARDIQDHLLPVGRLREPLRSLERADAIVITEAVDAGTLPIGSQRIWQVRRGIRLDTPPSRPVVFCGIARPEVLMKQLAEAGMSPVASRFFPDHHAYTARDISELRTLREESDADGFITTEKDAINLANVRSELQSVTVAHVTMELADPDDAINTILRRIEKHTPRT